MKRENVDTTHRQPCSSEITITSDGMADDRGHPIVVVHQRYLRRLETGVGALLYPHRKVDEGFFPHCAADGEAYPCSTRRLLFPGTGEL